MRTQIYVSAYAVYVSAFAVGGGQELFFISFHFFFFFSAECGFSHLDFEVAKAGPLLKKGGMLRYVAFFSFSSFLFFTPQEGRHAQVCSMSSMRTHTEAFEPCPCCSKADTLLVSILLMCPH